MRWPIRWMLLLLFPSLAVSSDLTGTWSRPRVEGSFSYVRAVVIDVSSQWLYFHYESDGRVRCEAFGIARRRSNLFVFRNQPADRFYEGSELYGTESNEACEISFELDGDTLKVRSTNECSSFCGNGAAVHADLWKVPSELPAATALQ